MCKIITYYLRLALTNSRQISLLLQVQCNACQPVSFLFFIKMCNSQKGEVENVLEFFFIYGPYEVGIFAVRVSYKSYKFNILEEKEYISQLAQTSNLKD